MFFSGAVTAWAPKLRREEEQEDRQAQARHGGSRFVGPALRNLPRSRQWQKRATPPIRRPMIPFRKMQGLGNDFVVFDARDRAVAMTRSQGAGHRRPSFRRRLRHPGADHARRRPGGRAPAFLQCRWRRSGILRQCHALRRAASDGRARPVPGQARQPGRDADLQRRRQGPGHGGFGRTQIRLARHSAQPGNGYRPNSPFPWTARRSPPPPS